MICWGAMGATCGIYGKVAVRPSRGILMLIGFGWGFIFGWIMNISYWISFVYPLNLQSFILTQASSFWFDLLHASGNVFFIYFMGKDIINILNRFKKRLTVEYY
jgi:energy-coupling factor transport system substrate-specific component